MKIVRKNHNILFSFTFGAKIEYMAWFEGLDVIFSQKLNGKVRKKFVFFLTISIARFARIWAGKCFFCSSIIFLFLYFLC